MKKLLSLVMVVLVGFFSCSVRGYEVNYFPDGGRKITYTYGELQQLGEKHKQLLAEIVNDISNKEKSYSNIKVVSNVSSVLCMMCGAGMCVSGHIEDGVILCALGVLGLVGVPMGLNSSIDNLIDQKYAIEERILEINAIKESIGGYISKQIVTNLDVERKFYYSLFVDKKGFVYKMEWCNAGLYSNAVLFETKYKLNVD